jgi:DNA-binding transcriptional regulator YhcF (GntR family)
VNPQTVVADVADELARRVATGEYGPGELVPSVRQVAAEFEVNRATAQLILGRLESAGFVEAKRGKGFTVRDVRLAGGVDVYRRLFRLSMGMAEVALETFHDIVVTEQQLLLDTLRAYTDLEHRIAAADLGAIVDRLERIARRPEPDLHEFLRLELSIVRALVSVVGQSMRLATLNSLGEMVLDVPEAVAAFFVVEPDVHVLVWRALISVWDSGGGPSESQTLLFEDLVTVYHGRVLARFEELAVACRTGSAAIQSAS